MNFLDLSGYSFTGKSYLYDLLVSSDEIKGFDRDFEFDLLRINGGLISLYLSLEPLHFSPIRASYGIKQYEKLCNKLTSSTLLHRLLINPGANYSKYFLDFRKVTDDFIAQLIDFNAHTYWPYEFINDNVFETVFNKCFAKLGFNKTTRIAYSRFSEDELLSVFNRYIQLLFKNCLSERQSTILLSNACEPYSPELSMNILGCKSIIVDRDPRDIYLSALDYKNKNNDGLADVVLGQSIDDFIQRYQILRLNNLNEKSLVVRFENIVMKDKVTIDRIVKYTGIDSLAEKIQNSNAPFSGIELWKSIKDKRLLQDINNIERIIEC